MICTTALLIQTEETKETDSDVRWRPLGTPTAWWCRTWGRGRVTNFEWRRKIDMASVPRAKQWPPEWWKKVSDCFTTRWIKIMSFVQKPPKNHKKPGLYLFLLLVQYFIELKIISESTCKQGMKLSIIHSQMFCSSHIFVSWLLVFWSV